MAEHSCVRRYRLARLEGMHAYVHTYTVEHTYLYQQRTFLCLF